MNYLFFNEISSSLVNPHGKGSSRDQFYPGTFVYLFCFVSAVLGETLERPFQDEENSSLLLERVTVLHVSPKDQLNSAERKVVLI